MPPLKYFFKVKFTSNARITASVIAILLGAYGLTMIHWIENTQQREIQISPREAAPDFFVTEARYLDYKPIEKPADNKDGSKQQSGLITSQIQVDIKSKTLSHFIETKTTLFEKPIIDLTDKSQQAWHITAETGEALRGAEEELTLRGNVQLTSMSSRHVAMEANELKIYPQTETIKTPSEVKMEIPRGKITAGGFESEINQGKLKLVDGVNAIYIPE